MRASVARFTGEQDAGHPFGAILRAGPGHEQSRSESINSRTALSRKGVMVPSFLCSPYLYGDTVPGAEESAGDKSSPFSSWPSYVTCGHWRDNRQVNQEGNSRKGAVVRKTSGVMTQRVWQRGRGTHAFDRLARACYFT